ncbi:MAG: acyl-CoA desaturase [Ignavibacteriae bacterium]|nr:MAG: acyl-CoA desaturase [Ignavibacteriota bacterium]
MEIIIIFFIAHWYLSLFSQSFLQHRYAAHASFTMSKFWERFFYVFAYITQGSSYMSARAYGILHRMHHAYADTDKDPHSPKYFSNFFTMMLHTRKVFADIFTKRVKIEERFTKNLPDWPWMDKLGHSIINKGLFALLYVVIYFLFAPYWWLFLLVPIHILMGPVHGTIINWFAHKYGKKSFEVSNTSKNLMPVDILMLGEDYHNNHHKFPASANFGYKWYEIDPIYYIMLGLESLGIIKIHGKGKYMESEY